MLMCVDIYVCNFIKDILCLPRPISPPVVRLDSGQGYSREYGFPSAHSINALNMPLYAVLYWVAHASLSIDGSGEYSLSAGVDSLGWLPVGLATLASLTFTLTIGASRIYTGMHSLTDVAGGLILGMVISYFWQFAYPAVDAFVFSAAGPAVFLLVAIALAGMHPNPIDPTPSFADTVSFLFTVVGVNAGSHMYHNLAQVPGSVLAGERDVLLSFLAHRHSSHPLSWMASALAGMWPGTVPFSMEYHGLMKALLRVIYGLAVVFISRALAREGSKILLRLVYRSLGLPDDSRQTDTSQDKGKVPSVVRATAAAGSVSFYKISRLGVDSVSRAFAYTVMGWFITCFIPASFPYIGL
ncbi:hypothetical protein H696_03091 [Fonticula alba]|uniref:Phosphatidic acid phosphatase type 2/haloperoxidase domain-containing protein n=1 Tax=Fonticula alba TaxID=691883 RepID=A0A058Z8Y9_FONAL|nr:hypothetical protein H696_03091 [Fonticula alba]KCV70740.1 hypothetical protein H696_03091 [Fonticula alba]|eukprot:XP_009495256.1 hypothetical protein H696_03091 [Fonticula alba]